ncbi:3-isopropylmalate dehydratase large subunit [Microbaculum marinisediminis]|uniref:3-isopropylmalate dehydratase n=1 Tax=Microbaculum marinisediminis TaxID=2931392 RepID=A0AAW5R229_9HYPH|nr:3-isopropylmalate dehydratase large subunit [Microbaculum sp. A6E488]MCT8974267.1 3-isopropylmalate dehydratase large subunit [Microbaculum sp. A6E488]
MAGTLYDKVFDAHVVREVSENQHQIAVDVHLINEVSSPQAFEDLHERGLTVAHPERTFACADHSISTGGDVRRFDDALCEAQVQLLARNTRASSIPYFDPMKAMHGIVHVVAPERGLTQPGMVIACGDSHTSTHGAFGTVAFGIGTSQVRDVLASQSLVMEKLKVRRIAIEGELAFGVFAKDVALHVIHRLGAKGGLGYAYEFCGSTVERFSMEERMTLCNMAVEGGARCGYVNPDRTTFDYLKGRAFAPEGAAWEAAVRRWQDIASEPDATWDDEVVVNVGDVGPMVTWGTSPDQSVPVDLPVPDPAGAGDEETGWRAAMEFMGMVPGEPVSGTRIDTAFIGSCTNGRLSDLEAVAAFLRATDRRVASGVRAMIVPGSRAVLKAAASRGFDTLFEERGFELRDAGCSLCCGMNADKLVGPQVCASSSNRNFRGRQGSPDGRTFLMSPVMVAAAALAGEITDVRAFPDATPDGGGRS